MKAVSAYVSQFGENADLPHTEIAGGSFLRFIEARATFHGAMIGAAAGEPFHHAGPLAAVSLPLPPVRDDRARPYSMFY
jgi:hypothetical protein